MRNYFQLTEHFNLMEFQCKGADCCGNVVKISSRLVAMLEALRQELGVPFVINSGYRCPVHNKRVSDATNSYHVRGMAVDIACPQGLTTGEFGELCLKSGFTGVGVYPTFVHVDVRPGPQIRFR